ncbi:peroxiredoxin [Mucilaginibacter ginsenosidivorans]|uniref:thioredoxin-dependent peroxiredoxin n=1 Tax=Mucilaginibacter ginsenosidivorans TaxID=398053 RepID=A0A5B8V260_9SPHI|nr:peroxiredoxin [Mucilaginibacter ginsenosidivorans]QEC64626.1 peroxiredoxin [Mucilaginibacter ginsenosidivorans]
MINFSSRAQGSKRSLDVGDKLPAFSLKDQDGNTFNSADHIGKSMMVIYFYPKDESMVCTKEACAFRDDFDDFTEAGAKVIGINGGTVASHKAFEQHYKLPFTLLSDPGDKVYKLFGVKGSLFFTGRKTFVIDLQGKIVYTHDGLLEGRAHADESLKYITATHK